MQFSFNFVSFSLLFFFYLFLRIPWRMRPSLSTKEENCMDCQSWQKVNRDNKIQLTQLTLFRSFAQNCAKSLKLKSDQERVAHDKRANRSRHIQKQAICSKKFKKSRILYMFSLFWCQRANRFPHSSLSRIFSKSDSERIAKVALNKRAKLNNYPRLLITKERPWAIR